MNNDEPDLVLRRIMMGAGFTNSQSQALHANQAAYDRHQALIAAGYDHIDDLYFLPEPKP
jgi:hypothetical protein